MTFGVLCTGIGFVIGVVSGWFAGQHHLKNAFLNTLYAVWDHPGHKTCPPGSLHKFVQGPDEEL